VQEEEEEEAEEERVSEVCAVAAVGMELEQRGGGE